MAPPPGRCLVMGVVNVTPDSFSDGGLWLEPQAAVAHGLALVADGADIVDVGGESTRPGAERVPEQLELERVVPVVAALADRGLVVSVDTQRASVAAAACAAGATIVNDVSGGTADLDLPAAAAQARATLVVTHNRGPSLDMASRAVYGVVVKEVCEELLVRRDAALAAGLAAEQIVLDPGLGFAKGHDHSWALLAGLPAVLALGHRVLVGASRKSFLGALLDGREPLGRDGATQAVTALVAHQGAWCVRVHEPRAAADAVRVVEAVHRAAR